MGRNTITKTATKTDLDWNQVNTQEIKTGLVLMLAWKNIFSNSGFENWKILYLQYHFQHSYPIVISAESSGLHVLISILFLKEKKKKKKGDKLSLGHLVEKVEAVYNWIWTNSNNYLFRCVPNYV